ncbi:MAG TPA: DUF2782 domain-containing protein [Gammaproteobacteria bacterium]|nr:DUF2782 domain-containing protein [Gammaproteobacteria bacterium]
MRLLILVVLLGMAPVYADEGKPDNLEAVPEPPQLPDPVESGEAIEPEVTIIQREDRVIEEYRINGHLYMVKITPSVGKPYFLVDRDGDGQLESRSSQLYEDITVPQWVLFSWD